jgi:hypothetical protein
MTFPQVLLAQIIACPVPREEIASALGVTNGIALSLSEQASLLTPDHIVERRIKGPSMEVEYRIRPSVSGELVGQIKEVRVE